MEKKNKSKIKISVDHRVEVSDEFENDLVIAWKYNTYDFDGLTKIKLLREAFKKFVEIEQLPIIWKIKYSR